jgi:hypothetical protein
MAYINLDTAEVIKNFSDPNGDLIKNFVITSISDSINLKVNGVFAVIGVLYNPTDAISVEYKDLNSNITLLNNTIAEDSCQVEFAVIDEIVHASIINSGYNVLNYDLELNKINYQRVTEGVIETLTENYSETVNPYVGDFTLKVSDNNTQQICWSNEATIDLTFEPECEPTPQCSADVTDFNLYYPGALSKSNFTTNLYADKILVSNITYTGGAGSYVNYNGLDLISHFEGVLPESIIIPFEDFNTFIQYITEVVDLGAQTETKGLEITYKLGYINTTNYTSTSCVSSTTLVETDLCLNVTCGVDETCINGVCTDSCNNSCPPGTECIDGTCTDLCGDTCVAPQVCDNGVCVDCTGDSQCPAGTVCFNGSCVDPCTANGAPCPEGTTCENGLCVQDEPEMLLWLDMTDENYFTAEPYYSSVYDTAPYRVSEIINKAKPSELFTLNNNLGPGEEDEFGFTDSYLRYNSEFSSIDINTGNLGYQLKTATVTHNLGLDLLNLAEGFTVFIQFSKKTGASFQGRVNTMRLLNGEPDESGYYSGYTMGASSNRPNSPTFGPTIRTLESSRSAMFMNGKTSFATAARVIDYPFGDFGKGVQTNISSTSVPGENSVISGAFSIADTFFNMFDGLDTTVFPVTEVRVYKGAMNKDQRDLIQIEMFNKL